MEVFEAYLTKLTDPRQRAKMEEVLHWVAVRFPDLAPRIAWNQPMFTHHGTFIIGFSAAKRHLAVAPERACIDHFSHELQLAGHDYSKELVRFPWDSPVDLVLLEKMIAFNILDKAACTTFWRKSDDGQ